MGILENLTLESLERNTETLNLSSGEYLYYDFSKSNITENDKEKITTKIVENGFESKLKGLLEGDNINNTESKPVLHYLLRDESVLKEVESSWNNENSNTERTGENTGIIQKAKFEIINEAIKVGKFTKAFKEMEGVTGEKLDTIVNIGIGGSDLGPRMVANALQVYSENRQIFFISNIDPSDVVKIFKNINPEKTLFIVVSKTFTTVETMENFKLALGIVKNRLENKFSEEEICNRHFVAVSSNTPETSKYGIKTVFKMWDFVGGRYSLWSAVGLAISLYIGFENYLMLLKGASQADKNFFSEKLVSVSGKMAINELFYISKGFNNKCLVCYDSYLDLLYKYLQQAEMESNGKHGSKQMIIWGGVGTDVQHSFFQLLHQGEQDIYLELLCPVKNICEDEKDPSIVENMDVIRYHHQLLATSCFAQSRSMLVGKKSEDINHHFRGDKPSVTVLYSKLTPETLGAMLAVYEHKIFISGIYFNINSFDQFGVELGKALAKELMKDLNGEGAPDLDESTLRLLSFVKKN